MTSKEWVKGVIYNLENLMEIPNENITEDFKSDAKMQLKAYNQVLKDLEVLEEIRNCVLTFDEYSGVPASLVLKKIRELILDERSN